MFVYISLVSFSLYKHWYFNFFFRFTYNLLRELKGRIGTKITALDFIFKSLIYIIYIFRSIHNAEMWRGGKKEKSGPFVVVIQKQLWWIFVIPMQKPNAEIWPPPYLSSSMSILNYTLSYIIIWPNKLSLQLWIQIL